MANGRGRITEGNRVTIAQLAAICFVVTVAGLLTGGLIVHNPRGTRTGEALIAFFTLASLAIGAVGGSVVGHGIGYERGRRDERNGNGNGGGDGFAAAEVPVESVTPGSASSS